MTDEAGSASVEEPVFRTLSFLLSQCSRKFLCAIAVAIAISTIIALLGPNPQRTRSFTPALHALSPLSFGVIRSEHGVDFWMVDLRFKLPGMRNPKPRSVLEIKCAALLEFESVRLARVIAVAIARSLLLC